MKGRPAKPTALKILEGAQPCRINRAEPSLPPGSTDTPAWLPDFAREHWAELAPMLSRAGLLTEGDRPALAALCLAYASMRLDPHDVKARESYRRMLVEFGLTPSSRSRIKSAVEKPRDALEEFLAG